MIDDGQVSEGTEGAGNSNQSPGGNDIQNSVQGASPAGKTESPQNVEVNDKKKDSPAPENTGAVEMGTGDNATRSNDPESPPSRPEGEPKCEKATLDLYIYDWHGYPVPNLSFQIWVDGNKIFTGKTDAKGIGEQVENLEIGSVFEVRVKKDAGDFKFAAVGKIQLEENFVCLKSPRQRFEFATYAHQGTPGKADKHKEDVLKRHQQKAEETANASRNPDKKPEQVNDRDNGGAPKAIVVGEQKNLYAQNRPDALAPGAGRADLEKVEKLITFATEQAGWMHPHYITTAGIIDLMKLSRYRKKGECKQEAEKVPPAEGKKAEGAGGANKKQSEPICVEHDSANAFGYGSSKKMCNKYVKIALWWAGYSHNNGDIDPKISAAKNMGPSLVAAGFRDITAELPDARWAAPGDVIVYKDKRGDSKIGHIDIRSYDGYISDFVETYLPVSNYEVTGIYRKYYDPLPQRRVMAMLDVIASRETKGLEKNKALFALNTPIDNSKYATNLNSHPWAGLAKPESIKNGVTSTAAGRYQITLTAWNEAIQRGNEFPDFSEATQNRLAVIRMEYRGALGLLRKGDIEGAVNKLKNEWVSLPGGSQSKGYSMSEFMSDYSELLGEKK